ncbi:MAG: hypothetical protein DRJ38_02675 [Thermoprotei archaeon]|nr:MAG: hypothetical protein DRJ38_02675 [Thermoprotei archaeon]
MSRMESVMDISSTILDDFILYILQNRIDKIEPVISPATGPIYPKIQPFLSKYRIDAMKLLRKAAKMGLLKRETYDRVITCPKCGSLKLIARLHCPRCESRNIESARILVHGLCGYAGIELDFKKEGEEELVCPNCGHPIGEDYQIIGELFSCLDCGHRFPVPDVKFECSECKENFEAQKARYTPVYFYEVIPEKLVTFAKRVALRNVREILIEHGYKLEEPPIIAGISGITHQFDMVGLKGDNKVAISHYDSSTGENLQSHILNILGKSTDIRDAKIIDLISANASTNGLRLFSTSKNQSIIIYKNLEELREKFREKIKKLESLSSRNNDRK